MSPEMFKAHLHQENVASYQSVKNHYDILSINIVFNYQPKATVSSFLGCFVELTAIKTV